MSKLNFSKGKFSRFISSKGFYVAIAVCLVGAGAATWLAVDRSITGIENNNNQMIESEQRWDDYPETTETEKKQSGVEKPKVVGPSPYGSSQSSSSSSPEPSEPASEQPASAPEASASTEPSPEPAGSPSLAYALPIKSEVIAPFSDGELVKNVTLNDWRTHDGMDIAADKGTDVMAAADGVVTEIRNDPLWGTVITIDHIDGNQTFYCGLDKAVPVKEGDSVMVQQVIGRLEGVPCEISQPSHLHFAMKSEGKWIDPLVVLQKAITD